MNVFRVVVLFSKSFFLHKNLIFIILIFNSCNITAQLFNLTESQNNSKTLDTNTNRIQILSKHFKITQECPFKLEQSLIVDNVTYCPTATDSLLCFPSIEPNTVVNFSCPYIHDIPITRPGIVASRYCYANSTWARTDYSKCVQYLISHMYKTTCRKVNKTIQINETYSILKEVVQCADVENGDHEDQAIKLFPLLFLIGYSISLVPVTLSIIIFWSFRALRCLRNIIHTNMLLTFIIKSLIFIIFNAYISNSKIDTDDNDNNNNNNNHSMIICLLFQVLWHYSVLTSFFWMMIEGAYLVSVIVAVYSLNRIKLWWYLIIGWVLPIIPIVPYTLLTIRSSNVTCQWIRSDAASHFELIIDIPIYIVLTVNFCLMIGILYVVIKKLKRNNYAARAQFTQSKKLIRATILLIPLLGLTYGLFFWLPKNPKSLISKIYCYVNIFLQTTQGIWVAILYCFYNEQVRSVLKNKFITWTANRNFKIVQLFIGRKKEMLSYTTTLSSSYMLAQNKRIIDDTRTTTIKTAAIMVPMLNKKPLTSVINENEEESLVDDETDYDCKIQESQLNNSESTNEFKSIIAIKKILYGY